MATAPLPVPGIRKVSVWLTELARRTRRSEITESSAKVMRTHYLKYVSWLAGNLGIELSGQYTDPVLTWRTSVTHAASPANTLDAQIGEHGSLQRYLTHLLLSNSLQAAQTAASGLKSAFAYLNKRKLCKVTLEALRAPDNPPRVPPLPMLDRLLVHLGRRCKQGAPARVRTRKATARKTSVFKGCYAPYGIDSRSYEMNLATAAVKFFTFAVADAGAESCLTEEGPRIRWKGKRKGNAADILEQVLRESPGSIIRKYLDTFSADHQAVTVQHEASLLRTVYVALAELELSSFDPNSIETPGGSQKRGVVSTIPEIAELVGLLSGGVDPADEGIEVPVSQAYRNVILQVFLRFVRDTIAAAGIECNTGGKTPGLVWSDSSSRKGSALAHASGCLLHDPLPHIQTYLRHRQTSVSGKSVVYEASALRRAFTLLRELGHSQFASETITLPPALPVYTVSSEGRPRRTLLPISRAKQYSQARASLIDLLVNKLLISFNAVRLLRFDSYDPSNFVVSVPFEGETVEIAVKRSDRQVFAAFAEETAHCGFRDLWPETYGKPPLIFALDGGEYTADDAAGVRMLSDESVLSRDFSITAIMQELRISISVIEQLRWDAYDSGSKSIRFGNGAATRLKGSAAELFDLWLRRRTADRVPELAGTPIFPARDGKHITVLA